MDEAAEPDKTGVEAKKKRSILGRIPTPLVVTLLGIGLTAWLLPAVTRQWDDRQKAQELETAVVGDMASATARALLGGEAIWSKQRVDRKMVRDAGSVSSLQLETRLRGYFGGDIVREWEIYTWLITRYDDAHSGPALGALLTATSDAISLDPQASDAIARVLLIGDSQRLNRRYSTGPDFSAAQTRWHEQSALLEQSALERLRRYLMVQLHTYPLDPRTPGCRSTAWASLTDRTRPSSRS
jgi:hypothetical protein